MVKSPIRGRFYARLILEKRALAKVLFLYFGLRNYSLIKNIIEPFFLNKFCLPHSQSLKLGNSDNIQRHKVSLGQSLEFFPVNFCIMLFTQFLISELNWEPKHPKTYNSCFYSTSFAYRRIRRTFFSWNKPNL